MQNLILIILLKLDFKINLKLFKIILAPHFTYKYRWDVYVLVDKRYIRIGWRSTLKLAFIFLIEDYINCLRIIFKNEDNIYLTKSSLILTTN